MADRRLPLLGQKQVGIRKYSASALLTGDDSGMCLSNEGAAGSITFTLPQAKPGYEYRLFVQSAHSVVAQPQAADNIRGKGAGVSISYGTAGGLLKLICLTSGIWEIEYNIGPFA